MSRPEPVRGRSRRRDYRLLLAAQSISNLGSSFTVFALPLLVFRLTGSPVDLAVATVAGFLPYLLFGLVIGAWVDRVDRRRLMIVVDLARGLTIGVVPALAAAGALTVWWVYAVAFTGTSLGIVTTAIESSAMPSLVPRAELADANGKLRASYAIAQVAGPLLAGALIGGGMPVTAVFTIDALSFVLSAALLRLVRGPFNADRPAVRSSLRDDIGAGLRYVLADPVLRNIAVHAALFNLIAATVTSQLVLFAHDRLNATDGQVGLLFAAGGLGTAVALFAAGRLGQRIPFAVATLGAVLCWSGLIVGLAASTNIWLGAAFWMVAAGLPSVYAVRTLTLRQTAVPDHLLGRVQTIAHVLAWSAQPVGALAGASIIHATGQIAAVYAGIGILVAAVTICFWLGPLGKPGIRLREGYP